MATKEYMREYRDKNREAADAHRRQRLARQRALSRLAARYPAEYQKLLREEMQG